MAVSQPEQGDNEFLNGINSFGLHQTKQYASSKTWTIT